MEKPDLPSLIIHPWPLADAVRVAAGAAPVLAEFAETRVWLLSGAPAQLPGAEILSPAELAAHRARDPGVMDEAIYFFCPAALDFRDLGRLRMVLFHDHQAMVAASRFADGANWPAGFFTRLRARFSNRPRGPLSDPGFGALLLAPGLAAQLPELTPAAAIGRVLTNDWPVMEIGANVKAV